MWELQLMKNCNNNNRTEFRSLLRLASTRFEYTKCLLSFPEFIWSHFTILIAILSAADRRSSVFSIRKFVSVFFSILFSLLFSRPTNLIDEWDSLCRHICPIHRKRVLFSTNKYSVIWRRHRSLAQKESNDDLLARDTNAKWIVIYSLSRLHCWLIVGVDKTWLQLQEVFVCVSATKYSHFHRLHMCRCTRTMPSLRSVEGQLCVFCFYFIEIRKKAHEFYRVASITQQAIKMRSNWTL